MSRMKNMEFNVDRLIDDSLEWEIKDFSSLVHLGITVPNAKYISYVDSDRVVLEEIHNLSGKSIVMTTCTDDQRNCYSSFCPENSEEYSALKQVITRLQNKHNVEAMNPKLEYKVEVFETPYNKEVLVNGIPIEEVDPVEIESIAHELVSDLDVKQLIKLISKFSRKASTADLDERGVKNDIYRVTTIEL